MLRNLTMVLAAGLLTVPASAREIGVMDFPEGEVQHVVRADDTPWVPCPPNLPSGCELAVLDGDPAAPDLFTVRFHMLEDTVVPAHRHPKDERVTVIRGTAAVAFGEGAEREDATEFGPGDYYVNRRDTVHTVWIDAGAVLQITGIGPWEVIPVKEPSGEAP